MRRNPVSEWSEERLRELAAAEEEALAESDGLLACSPEIWDEMNTAYIVLIVLPNGGTQVHSIYWDEDEAKVTAKEQSLQPGIFGYVNQVTFKPRQPKFSELMNQEMRVFPAESDSVFLDSAS